MAKKRKSRYTPVIKIIDGNITVMFERSPWDICDGTVEIKPFKNGKFDIIISSWGNDRYKSERIRMSI